MSDKIRVNYPALEEMAQHFDKLAEETEGYAKWALQFGHNLADGIMIGDTGDTVLSAIQGPFAASTNRLTAKFREVAKDIRGAIADMRAADRDAGSQF
jgi:uncharacterized protein YukE